MSPPASSRCCVVWIRRWQQPWNATAPLAGLHGFGGQPGSFTQSHGAGWALVGDAAYFKDPLTAHGITDALLHAELLADAITAGGDAALAAYEARRTAVALPVFEATEAIASFDWTLEELRGLHTRLSRAMAKEIDAALALFGQPPGDLAGPLLDHDDLGGRAGGSRPGQHEQELAPVR